MKITIVYDNEVFEKNNLLKSDWGFSCFIQTTNKNLLFDTGAKGNILLRNMKQLCIDPHDIDKIIISHEHWDHNGGLELLSSFLKDVEIFRFNKDSAIEHKTQILVNEPLKIADNIYSTGKLPGQPVDEQSLIIKRKKDCIVITGCSHSGVDNILKSAEKYGSVNGIIGGFHGFKDFSVFNGINLICPCHCTKYKKNIKKLFPSEYTTGGVGRTIELDEDI